MSGLTRTPPSGWLSHAPSTQNRAIRTVILKHWVLANGWGSAEEGIAQFTCGKTDLYIAADSMVKRLLQLHLAPLLGLLLLVILARDVQVLQSPLRF